MLELGLPDEHALQSWFIRQMNDFLIARGRRLVGWDEILEGGLAAGATVMSWRGIEGGIAAAKSGHDVVMAPNSHTYFDYYQAEDRTQEPLAIGGYIPLEKVYAYDPIPEALSAAEARHILGTQGQLWTEYIPDGSHAEYMAFPRLCALAEVAWTPQEARSYDDFSGRLQTHLKRLEALAVNFRR
jgi:hexosaminidase